MSAPRTATALLLASLLVARAAHADVSDADRATARNLAQQGQDALDARDFTAAAERFRRADALVHAPTLLLGMARAHVGLGQLVSAQETYGRIVREGVAPGSPPVWGRALADAKKELAALAPRVPSVTIEVRGAAGARVTVDDAPVPEAALGVARPVDPGPHRIRAEADGFTPAESTVISAEASAESVTLTLTPVPPSGPPPPPPSTLLRTLGFAALGVGGAGVVMGVVAGVVAVEKHASLAAVCSGGLCVGQESAIAGYHLAGGVATTGFVVGAAFAATGVVLVMLAPRRPAEVAVTPVLGAGWAGIEGRFR